jgi:hypothetical protein
VPRYFFDTYDGHRFVADEEGQQLENFEAARAEAQRALPEMARDEIPVGDGRTFVVSVKNETGRVVLRTALSLVVETFPEDPAT